MVTAATAAAIQAPLLLQSPVHRGLSSVRRKLKAFEPRLTTSPSRRDRFLLPLITAASKSPNNSNADDSSQDDLYFLLKLGAGSFAGAAAIKYGSILVPEITRPNITQALIMIFAPCLVSVLILITQSRVEKQ